MNEKMTFPNTLDEFIEEYSFIDDKEFYTNGSELIPTFRIKQWEEHKTKEKQDLIKYLEDFISKEDYEVNIKGNYLYIAWCNAYRNLLEKIKEGNYE